MANNIDADLDLQCVLNHLFLNTVELQWLEHLRDYENMSSETNNLQNIIEIIMLCLIDLNKTDFVAKWLK